MKKFLLGVTACVLGLAIAGVASAQGPVAHRPGPGPVVGPRGISASISINARPGFPGSHGHVAARPYYASHGVRFNGGFYYNGHDHNHWGHRVWNARYNRYHYWDPHLNCYYYWSAAQSCYYPIDSCGY